MRRIGLNTEPSIKVNVYREIEGVSSIDYSDPLATSETANLVGTGEFFINGKYNFKNEKYGDFVGGKVQAFGEFTVQLEEKDTLTASNGKSYKVISEPRNGGFYPVIVTLERLK